MITITVKNKKTLEVKKDSTAREIFAHFNQAEESWLEHTIAARVNNEVCSLTEPIQINAEIEPVLLKSNEGSAIYRRSLCFVLAAAANCVFPKTRLVVGHSLGYGYFYTLDKPAAITQNDIDTLNAKMHELITQSLPIEQNVLSYKEAVELFESLNLSETRKQLAFHCPPVITINSLAGFSDLYFAPLTSTTETLKVFELLKYQDGFLLRFPQTFEPEKLTEFEDVPQLFSVYKRYKTWGKLMNVTSAASLNQLIHERRVKEFVDITETLQAKCFADAADTISNRKNIKVVLIAGPSSSGKTTSSKKLAMQLQVNGYNPQIISLDDYYIGRELTPKDAEGNYDYECLEALNVKLLNENLVDLFKGKEVPIPSYDFVNGKSFYKPEKMLKLSKNDILVMEGIHGLNDRLTPLVSADIKFKIYVSALTQLNLDDHNRIPTSDNRLIRRIVRDNQFRGKSAATTISMWNNVQRGEKLHIFPFQDNADIMINTALDYELPVLKTYADPLLRCVPPTMREYSEAARLLGFLNNFSPIPANFVPGQSIIREFIGGSEFKY